MKIRKNKSYKLLSIDKIMDSYVQGKYFFPRYDEFIRMIETKNYPPSGMMYKTSILKRDKFLHKNCFIALVYINSKYSYDELAIVKVDCKKELAYYTLLDNIPENVKKRTYVYIKEK